MPSTRQKLVESTRAFIQLLFGEHLGWRHPPCPQTYARAGTPTYRKSRAGGRKHRSRQGCTRLSAHSYDTSLPSIFCVALGGGGGGRDAQDNGLCAPSALSPVGSQAGELQLRCEVIEPVMIDVRDHKGGT